MRFINGYHARGTLIVDSPACFSLVSCVPSSSSTASSGLSTAHVLRYPSFTPLVPLNSVPASPEPSPDMAAASQPRQLTRLHIPPAVGPQQQPFIYGDNAPMYSPSLPTAINVGAHNGFPIPHHHLPLHTPMQAQFFPRQPPGPPGRPGMHRAHPSMVLPPGMMPPPGMPMTPLGQMGFQNHMPPPFVPRSKRTQSVSTGGPPKAVLGGPQRKISPMPPSIAPAAPAPEAEEDCR